jgi:hypothetical protein
MFTIKKFKKLFTNPKLFFKDYLKKIINEKNSNITNKKIIDKKNSNITNKKIIDAKFILIYGPIDNSGLYKHLVDVTDILEEYDLPYRISWHTKPKIRSNLEEYYIDYEYSKTIKPNLIINIERYNNAHKLSDNIFYINLDWLKKKDFLNSKLYADTILYPNKYKLNLFKKVFANQNFLQINWLGLDNKSSDRNNYENQTVLLNKIDKKKIKILYFAKKLQDHRSNHKIVINAFKKYKKNNIYLTIKSNDLNVFNTNPNINYISNYLNNDELIELYKSHDVVLIPNSCEGNGLLIFEALEMGCIPVVIDGYPMKTLVDKNYAYLLPYVNFKRQNYAKYYEINSNTILNFLNDLDFDDVVKKKNYLINNSKIINAERNKDTFVKKILGLLDYYDQIPSHFDHTTKIRKLSFDERNKILEQRKLIIDIFISSYNRFDFFHRCIDSLNKAIEKSKHQFRVHIFLDDLKDYRYVEIIKKNRFNYYILNQRLGLPYFLEHIKFILKNYSERLTHKSRFFCYLQDDCLINENINYFDDMVTIAYNSVQKSHLNFISGFHNEIHPGFLDFKTIDGKNCKLSNSIDGKNIFGCSNYLLSIPKFSFFNKNLRKQGNPGPALGSNFDLWLWRDNPLSKNKLNIIYKNAIIVQNNSKYMNFSTWNNDESQKTIISRIKENKIYK